MSTNITSRWASPPRWPRSRSSNSSPSCFSMMCGGGVGGTADYNNFVYASENSDANATITKIHGKHEDFVRLRVDEAVSQRRPAPRAGRRLRFWSVLPISTSPASNRGGSDFASLLIGMGSAGNEANGTTPILPKTSSPPSPTRTMRRLSRTRTTPPSPDHHRRPALGHFRRTQRAFQPPGILRSQRHQYLTAFLTPARKSTSTAAIALRLRPIA